MKTQPGDPVDGGCPGKGGQKGEADENLLTTGGDHEAQVRRSRELSKSLFMAKYAPGTDHLTWETCRHQHMGLFLKLMNVMWIIDCNCCLNLSLSH